MDNTSFKEKIKKVFDKRIVRQLFKYGLTTGVSYIALFVGTYLLIDVVNLPGTLSYAITLTIVYIGVFFSYLHFVFKKAIAHDIITRFVFALIIFWILNNGLFYILYDIFRISYIIAILSNLIVFGIIRFFVQRRFVFRAYE